MSARPVSSILPAGSQRSSALTALKTGKPRVGAPQATRMAAPKPKKQGLSDENEELLKRLLITISKGERSIERQRQVLARLSRFEPHAAFQRIDRD